MWPLAAEKLEEGREVLFIGLGCDAAALYSYLKARGTDTSRLFTAELICFGPVLPEVHRQYVDALEAKYRSRIVSFSVRYKAKGWTPKYIRAEFENGQEFITPFNETDYGQAFGLYSREVCYKCRFKGSNHQADVTLGDYWGLTPEMPGWNSNGVSIFIVRTEKGEELLRKVDPQEFVLRTEDVYFALSYNPMYSRTRTKPEDYGKFCADLESLGLHRAMVRHYGHVRYLWRKVKPYLRKAKRLLKKILLRR